VEYRFSPQIESIPATTPFIGPETLGRRVGRPMHLRLGANESLFGPSPRVLEVIRDHAAEVALYGDPEAPELRDALGGVLGCTRDEIRLGSGIDELLSLVLRAVAGPGDAVVTTLGSYPTFDYGVRACGATLVQCPYRADGFVDIDALIAASDDDRVRLVYLANPDNPSGTLTPAADVLRLEAALRPDQWLLLDEAYADFADPDELPKVPTRRLIRTRTFSKAHAMAGMRLGVAQAPVELLAQLDKFRMHFGVNRLALLAGLAAIEDRAHVASVVAQTRLLQAQISQKLPGRVRRTWTNFSLIDCGSKERAEATLAALLQEGVFVRKPAKPPLDGYLRVSIGPESVMEEFLGALRRVEGGA
jgi:histidinol-phosphate aminotransferase